MPDAIETFLKSEIQRLRGYLAWHNQEIARQQRFRAEIIKNLRRVGRDLAKLQGERHEST